MPMIDIHAPAGTFADPHALAAAAAATVKDVEGVPDIPMFRSNTAAFVHEAVTEERVSAVIRNVAGDAVRVGPIHAGPAGMALASAVGEIGEAQVTKTADEPLAYTTVLTVMDNLHRKGYLAREKAGRAFRYQPTKDRSAHTAELMHELLSGSGDSSVTLLRFLDTMSPSEVKRLKRALGD